MIFCLNVTSFLASFQRMNLSHLGIQRKMVLVVNYFVFVKLFYFALMLLCLT